MNGPRTIILPIGTMVNGAASASAVALVESQYLGMSVDASWNVQFTSLFGSTVYNVACGNLANASAFMTSVQNFLASSGSTPTFQPVPFMPSIISFTPNPFALLTDTITITGVGFSAATVGKLHIEDLDPGGSIAASMDGDTAGEGYWMQCTFVNSTTLTAVLGGSGDGILPAGVAVVYYEDTNLVKSNALLCETNGTPTFGILMILP